MYLPHIIRHDTLVWNYQGCTLLSFSRHAVACRGTTCGKTFHGISHGIPPNPPRTSTASWNPDPNLGAVNIGVTWGLPWHSVGLPWSAVEVAEGVAARRAMKFCATPCGVVGMPWYAMGVTMAMPRKNLNRAEPWTFCVVYQQHSLLHCNAVYLCVVVL